MSEQELERVDDSDDVVQETDQLDEFKSDHSGGGPVKGAEVPEPVSKNTKRKADKTAGDKSNPKNAGSTTDTPGKVSKPETMESKIPGTRLGLVNSLMNVMAGMKKADLEDLHDAINSTIAEQTEEESSKIVVVPDDIKEIFGDEELSEAFMDRATTVFEAAVGAKLAEESIRLQEEFDALYEEKVEQAKKDLDEKADEYLSYTAKEWMKDNQVAIDSGFKAEIAESFMNGLKQLFVEHYIDVPEEQVDVIDEFTSSIADLETKIEEQTAINMDLNSQVEKFRKKEIFDGISEGIADTDKEKLDALASGLTYDDLDEFEKKLIVVKENYFPSETSTEDSAYDEEIEVDEVQKVADPAISQYMDAISRTIKK